jgi:hypothetical protein
VNGEITKLARYKSVENGTRISIDVADNADSCFILFRHKPLRPSVVHVADVTGPVSPSDLELSYDNRNKLTAETSRPGTYVLSMSDNTQRRLVIEGDDEAYVIEGPWLKTKQDQDGYSVLQEVAFTLPTAFGKGRRIILDLGDVSVMAKVTLNGRAFDTRWMPPFTLDVTDALNRGENHLQILVTSTSEGRPKLGEKVQLRTRSRKIVE